MFQKIAPILPAINTIQTSLFYRDHLNFEISYSGNFLVLTRENIQLYFVENSNRITFQPTACYIFVSNIQDLYAKFSSMNMILPGGQMIEKPGRIKEFYILDNNGHRLMFGEKG